MSQHLAGEAASPQEGREGLAPTGLKAYALDLLRSGRREGRRADLWLGGLVLFLVAGAAAFDYLTRGFPWLLEQVVYLPILLAAVLLGQRGGTVVGLLVALLMAPLLILGPGEEEGGQLWWAKSALYAVFGAVAGALFAKLSGRLERLERRARRLSLDHIQTLSSLAHTVEVRDRHTRGHSERVAHNALVLGRELGFAAQHQEVLYWSALLHDLGKIAIADYILLKDAPLSPAEYEEVKRHPEYGAVLLSSLSGKYAPIAEIVRSHHERWDGLGYPRALSGISIPLMARVISVVDVFEALTSERAYRKPMTPAAALEVVREGAGRQFDPNLVDAFVLCFERGELSVAGVPEPQARTRPNEVHT